MTEHDDEQDKQGTVENPSNSTSSLQSPQEQESPPSDVQQERSTGLNEQNGSWIVKYRPVLKVVFFTLAGLWVLLMLWGHYHHDGHAKAATANAQNNSGNGSGQFAQNLGAGAGHTPPDSARVSGSSPNTGNGKGNADKGASDAPSPPSGAESDANANNGKSNDGGTSDVAQVRTWVSAPLINTSGSPLTPSGFSGNGISDTQTDPNTGLTASDRAQIATLQAEQANAVNGSSSDVSAGTGDGGSHANGAGAVNDGNTALGGMLQGTSTPATQATLLMGQDYLLPKGSIVNAVLDTRINSSVAGMTKCTVTHNIYSANGATVLIPKGSIVTGEYQSSVMQGQARLFVLWERLRTPSGVVVNLASPSTGTLGQSGIGGAIETHFWKRFGGAIMLSFVNDFGNYLSNLKSASTFSSTQQAAQSLATESLRNTINIPPTIIVPQGSRIAIFVARDVSFSGVYKLVTV